VRQGATADVAIEELCLHRALQLPEVAEVHPGYAEVHPCMYIAVAWSIHSAWAYSQGGVGPTDPFCASSAELPRRGAHKRRQGVQFIQPRLQ
jgi:hypothetical protein